METWVGRWWREKVCCIQNSGYHPIPLCELHIIKYDRTALKPTYLKFVTSSVPIVHPENLLCRLAVTQQWERLLLLPLELGYQQQRESEIRIVYFH